MASFEKKRAGKAFIFFEGKLLIVKRSKNSRYPNVWEIPGGRLLDNETIENGLKREVKEEVGLNVNVTFPLNVHHFKRSDNQEIHMISFLCDTTENSPVLSEEHEDFSWVSLDEAKNKLHDLYQEELKTLQSWFE